MGKGRCRRYRRNGFRGPSFPACASVPHSCVFLKVLLTLAAFVCGGVPGRTEDQLVPCSPDESLSQVRVRVRPTEGCDILHFCASGGRLNLSSYIIGGDDLGLHVVIVPKQRHLLWEPLLCQCVEFALYGVNFVLAVP